MYRFKVTILISMLLSWPMAGQGVTPKHFEVNTTADLVTLCSVTDTDLNASEAIHFCHGFLVGAYHYYVASTTAPGAKKFVCLPEPKPSRNQGIVGFVDWTKDNPQYMDKEAVNTLFRYLEKKFPCTE